MAWPTATIPLPRGASVWDGPTVAADPGSWTLELADATPDRIDERLRRGRGFVVVSGFPVDDRTTACERFTALAARLGLLLPQNTAGDLLHLVQTRDGGTERSYGSRGSGDLLFHTDQAAAPPPDRPRVFALLSLDRAARGGHTQLASGHALLRELLDPAPALAAALRTAVPFSRDPDGVSDAPPVLAPMVEPAFDERPALRFNRYFVEVGARETATEMPPGVVNVLDSADEVLERGHLVHQLLLEPGQAVFVDNLTVLHNRTAYEDGDGHRRCLARVWVR
jgi:alpha-ketoglutarate-dependent taurine dioxygenase